MMYLLWSRRKYDETPLWADMPYAPRDKSRINALLEYYERTFPNQYEYEIVPVGQYPKHGMHIPC